MAVATEAAVTVLPPCEGGDCVGTYGKCFDGDSASPCCDPLADRCVQKHKHFGQCLPRWKTATHVAALGWTGEVLSDCPADKMSETCIGKKHRAYKKDALFTSGSVRRRPVSIQNSWCLVF